MSSVFIPSRGYVSHISIHMPHGSSSPPKTKTKAALTLNPPYILHQPKPNPNSHPHPHPHPHPNRNLNPKSKPNLNLHLNLNLNLKLNPNYIPNPNLARQGQRLGRGCLLLRKQCIVSSSNLNSSPKIQSDRYRPLSFVLCLGPVPSSFVYCPLSFVLVLLLYFCPLSFVFALCLSPLYFCALPFVVCNLSWSFSFAFVVCFFSSSLILYSLSCVCLCPSTLSFIFVLSPFGLILHSGVCVLALCLSPFCLYLRQCSTPGERARPLSQHLASPHVLSYGLTLTLTLTPNATTNPDPNPNPQVGTAPCVGSITVLHRRMMPLKNAYRCYITLRWLDASTTMCLKTVL